MKSVVAQKRKVTHSSLYVFSWLDNSKFVKKHTRACSFDLNFQFQVPDYRSVLRERS